MPKAKRGIIFLVIFLLVGGALAFAGLTLVEKQKLQDAKAQVEQELSQTQERDNQKAVEIQRLGAEIQKLQNEKSEVENKLKLTKGQMDELNARITTATQESDKLKERLEGARKERDELLARVQTLQKEQAAFEEMRANAEKQGQKIVSTEAQEQVPEAFDETDIGEVPSAGDEQYWASVLKSRAALEVEVERLKEQISNNSIEVVELKQKNADLEIRIDAFVQEKDELVRTIQTKEDMVNKLSLDLARTKNDGKVNSDHTTKVTEENKELRKQIKQLVATKSALEKTIVRVSQDKTKIEKQLVETEAVIQGKIDEIWGIKESLDNTMKRASATAPVSSDVELSPIVVSSDAPNQYNTGMTKPGFDGSVVSINEENNFVIVNFGENQGLRLGDSLSVYRDSKFIARLEVIQVRKDIAAADIKDQMAKVQVGDTIR